MTTEFAEALRQTGSDKDHLERLNRWLEVALDNMARGLSMFDAEQRLILCNQVYRDIYKLPVELTRPGTPLADIVRYHVRQETGRDGPEEIEAQRQWIAQHVAELARGRSFSHTQHLRGGRTILVCNQPLSDGSWVDLQEDITERCQAEQRISWLAHHDSLTEVPNRFHFNEQLAIALQALPPGEGLALHWIDLDRFKVVNDELGHAVGDALLKNIGGRLQAAVRRPDFVGRLGGDEFAIVQANVTNRQQAIAFAERLLRLLNQPHQLMGHSVDMGASIGIALAPEHGTNAEDLLKKADLALYSAKSAGRGTYVLFNPHQSYEKQARRRLEADLKSALPEHQLELYYQPIRDAKTHQIKSCEALMRWHHPQLGLIPPGDFIPLAEESGLILSMGEWALQQACAEAVTWPTPIGVTVNLSAVQFRGSDVYKTVEAALAKSGLEPSRLELEITESVLMHDDADTLATLHKLREKDIRIALDDFGTAFASLGYLRSFPFDTIKIDRSFARDLPERRDCTAIIRSVASLAHALNMRSVAEGIETQEQLAIVTDMGCDEVQGYYFNRPIPAAELANVLAQHASVEPP
jgi:diguanylate cyclase (GGDEF)-like protein